MATANTRRAGLVANPLNVAINRVNMRSGRAMVKGFRIGHGFDAHRFRRGRKLMLGGVEIPHDHGLHGHSDADAVLHALMNAMLGALCEGDIGSHFPDHDPAYKNIESAKLLK